MPIKLLSLIKILSLIILLSISSSQAEQISLDSLLNEVKSGLQQDRKLNQQRLTEFKTKKEQQVKLLNAMKASRAAEDKRSDVLEKQFEKNEIVRSELEEKLRQRLGSLKELFGVLQQVSNDSRGQFSQSLTQIQFGERDTFLQNFAEKMESTTELPALEEIQQLWFELQREMTESGKVVRFNARIADKQGIEQDASLIRVGLFNLVSNGKYYQYVPETGRVIEYPRQPSQRHLQGAQQLSNEDNTQLSAFALDPSRGQLLGLLVQAPDWRERIEQGGEIAYIILGLGLLAVLIALERLLTLNLTHLRVSLQARRVNKPGNNALGRIIQKYHQNTHLDNETLELKLGEQVLKESLRVNRRIAFIKIIAVISPLLGLLGTVTGMIITFQAITLFGAGDPKLMSGGISQALVTTVLGLAVAIPAILMHAMAQGKAKRISEVLEQQAMGLVAEQAEAKVSEKTASEHSDSQQAASKLTTNKVSDSRNTNSLESQAS